LAATQSGTWNVTNISGTVSLPTGAATSANQPSNIAIGASTASQTGNLEFGLVTSAAPTYTTGTINGLSLDTSGNLRVTGTQSGAWSVRLQDGSGNSITSDARGSARPLAVEILDGAGAQITSFGGSNASVSATAAAVPGSATYLGANVGGNLTGLTATGTSLNVNITGGAGSGGTAMADSATFTFVTTQGTPAFGVFQTTATNNALTSGQAGAWQMTAQRAGFVNLRNASGTEIGTSGAPVRVDPTGTTTQPVSLTSTTITGTVAVTQSGTWNIGSITTLPALPANQSVNTAQINGVTPLMGNGVTGTGSQRVTIASDNTAFSVNTIQSGTWNIGTVTTITNPVAATQSGTWTVQQGTPPWTVGGDTASGSSDANNPIKIGGVARTANPTAVTTGQRVNATFDKLGKQVVVGAIRDLKGVQKTSISTTSETTVVTAGAAGVFNDVYAIVVTNKSAVNLFVDFKDATAGTTRMTLAAPASDTRGFTVAVDSAMVQATAANNWTATLSGTPTSATVEISILYVSNT
jgi:hypothetical protein